MLCYHPLFIRPFEFIEATFRDRNVQDTLLSNGDFAANNTDEWTNATIYLNVFDTLAYAENYELRVKIDIGATGDPTSIPNFYSDVQAISVRGESDQIQVKFKVRCTEITMDGSFGGPDHQKRTIVTCRLRKGSPTGSVLTSGLPLTMTEINHSTYSEYILLFNLSETDNYYIEFLVDKHPDTLWSENSIIEVRFDDIGITALYTDGPDITFDAFYKITNTDSDFIDKFEHEMFFGDSVQDNDIGSFQIDGTRTKTWDRFGKTENTSIQILSAQNIIENFGQYKDYLRFQILDPDHSIKAYNLLNTDSKDYQILSHTIVFAKSKKKHIKTEVAEVLNTAVGTTVTQQLLTTIDGKTSSASTVINYSPVSIPSKQDLQSVTNQGATSTNDITITVSSGGVERQIHMGATHEIEIGIDTDGNNAVGRIYWNDGEVVIETQTPAGLNKNIVFNNAIDGIRVDDSFANPTGFYYTGDFSGTQTRGNRWIPDKGYVDSVAGSLDGLTDTLITAIASGEVLKWDGTKWVNNTLSEAGILGDITGEPLSDLSDVTITAIASGELLAWTGTTWINVTKAEASISAVGHQHVENDITDLGDYLEAVITSIGVGELLKWDGADWINNTLSEAGIEPAISPKNSGFNKSLGTSAGTVSEGNHTHTSTYQPLGPTLTAIIDIGDWNMDGTSSVSFAHGLTLSKIRGEPQVMIRNDAGTEQYPLNRVAIGASAVAGGVVEINATNIQIGRATGGFFDGSADFDDTSYNRGWVTIEYIP